jgi:signal transduction histidine kinase/ActR/RegA family two-component response regulator
MQKNLILNTFSRAKGFLYALFTSGYGDSVDIQLRGKIILLNTVAIAAVIILTPFGISRLLQGSITLGCIDLLAAIFFTSLSIYHWALKRIVIPRIVSISIITLLFGYLAISTGYHDTGLLWSYCLPAAMIFMIDRKRGSLLLLLYMLIVTACFMVPFFPSYHNYSKDLKIAFLSSFIAVWVVAYYFSYIMSSLQTEVVQNNVQLQKTITELRETKDELFHAQKLEAIGRLAGGVAHDFNNILGAISGYADLIRRKYAGDPTLDKYATSIINSSVRAADLTAKLLAYARKGRIEMTAFDMHQVVSDVIDICKHTMDKKIILCQDLAAAQSSVMGDRNQLQNAVMNLALNARDAMSEGGKMTFATEDVILSEGATGNPAYSVTPGRYLKFCLIDTGTGMDQATLAKAFEPFFTTKEKGKGTGLGLSSVYGTVKSHNGYVELKSEVGVGTRAEIYLPLTRQVEQKTGDAVKEISRGHGTVLFADDEQAVREMTSEMIRELGYSVVTCADGQEALEHYQAHSTEIDLVVLDIIMPRLGGYDCFKAMKAINPKLKALACSGYVINDEVRKMLEQGALGFIQKPFSLKTFAGAIRSALSGKALSA